MERRKKGQIWYWFSLIVVAVAAIVTGYFLGLERGLKEGLVSVKRETPTSALKPKGLQPQAIGEKKTYTIKRAEPVMSPEVPETCSQIDEKMVEFFKYLDQKESIRKLDEGSDTFKIFREIAG